jgi:predicted DNA-binding transcriptional regulator AlpA
MTTAKTGRPWQSHAFSLILAGVSESTNEMADALYEAGCDDALLGSRDGVVFLDFDREAPSFREAMLRAIADVGRAGYGVARVEPDDLVTAAEIARRLGRSRESVRQHIVGLRGAGGFPAPVSSLKGRSPLWRWAEVAAWFADRHPDGLPPTTPREACTTIAIVNDLLDLSRHVRTWGEVKSLLDQLGRAVRPAQDKRE